MGPNLVALLVLYHAEVLEHSCNSHFCGKKNEHVQRLHVFFCHLQSHGLHLTCHYYWLYLQGIVVLGSLWQQRFIDNYHGTAAHSLVMQQRWCIVNECILSHQIKLQLAQQNPCWACCTHSCATNGGMWFQSLSQDQCNNIRSPLSFLGMPIESCIWCLLCIPTCNGLSYAYDWHPMRQFWPVPYCIGYSFVNQWSPYCMCPWKCWWMHNLDLGIVALLMFWQHPFWHNSLHDFFAQCGHE